MSNRWSGFYTFWGRKGMGFLVCVAAMVVTGIYSPAVAEAVAMWITGCFSILAGADAAITIGTGPKKPPPQLPVPPSKPLKSEPVEQAPEET